MQTKTPKTETPKMGLLQILRRIHPLTYIGAVGYVVSLAANYYIIYVTPAALWNGPRSAMEQRCIIGLQAASMALVLTGYGILVFREEKAKRKQNEEEAAKKSKDEGN